MLMNMMRANPSDQDIANMLSNLEEAHKYNEQGKKAYQLSDYRGAAHHFHRCLLYAKAVVQLTSDDLRSMARAQGELSPQTEEKSRMHNNVEAGSSSSDKQSVDKDIHDMQEVDNVDIGISQSGRNRLDSTTRGQEIHNEAKELMTKCYNNLAICLLARGSNTKEDFMRAVFYCDNVLKEDPGNEKALFRKGLALMNAQKWDKAIEQFEQCKNNAQARLHTVECNRQIEEDRRRRDAEIRANFAKARAAANEDQVVGGPNNANGHPPPDGNPPTMNGHVQH